MQWITNMPSRFKVMFLWTICSTYKVVTASTEVVWVKRNVRDSFRVGRGCTNNSSVCTSNANCVLGLCFCVGDSLHFLKRHVAESTIGYGCVKDEDVPYYLSGKTVCQFGRFQVIPYSRNGPVTQFNYSGPVKTLKRCSLAATTKAKVNFPDDGKEIEMQWLDSSYVNFTVSGDVLFFKWKRSVPNLQGTIITFKLVCTVFNSPSQQQPCLQAKVLGTWMAGTSKPPSVIVTPLNTQITSEVSPYTTTPTPATTSEMSPATTLTAPTVTTDDSSDITTTTTSMTTPPRSSTRSVVSAIKPSNTPKKSRPPREVPGGDGDFNWTLIVVAVVVAVIIVMVLVFVIVLLKRWKKKNQTNSRRGSVEARASSTSMREIGDRTGDARRLDLNEEVPADDTTETAVAEWNPTYSTPKCQSVLAVVNPSYGVLDVSEGNFSSDPACEKPDAKKEQDISQSDPGYEGIVVVKERDKTVDNKKKGMNGGNSKSDIRGENIAVKRDVSGAEKRNTNPDSKPDKKMEARNIKSGEVDSTNSCNKNSHKSRDVKKDRIDTKSSEPTYAKPDKESETSEVKGKESANPDSYEEPGYEALDITKKENDGRNSDATYAKPNKKGSAGNIKTGESIDLDSYKEPGYETPDATKKKIEGTTTDTTYAKPNKKRSAGSIKTGESIDPNFLEEPGCETPDLNMKEIDGSSSDTAYAKPDKKRSAGSIKTGENIHPGSYEEPGYETPDTTKKEVQGTSSDVTYAKPDKKRKEVGPQGHSASDKSSKNGKGNACHSTPDIKRIEINGDLYALPDKNKNSEKADGLDKDENPADMVPGSENGSERQDQSGKATAEPKMEKYKEL